MNKRELRKIPWQYAKPAWCRQAGRIERSISVSEHIGYGGAAQRRTVNGQQILILTFYDFKELAKGNTTPLFRLFQGKKEFVNEDFEPEGKGKWRSRSIEYLVGYSYVRKGKGIFLLNQSSEDTVQSFTKKYYEGKAITSLMRLQREIMDERLEQRRRRIQAEVRKELAGFPKEPRGYRKWIQDQALPSYVFYEYSRRKVMEGYCTHCQTQVQVSGIRHNQKGVCPHCKHPVTFKAQGRTPYIYDTVNTVFFRKGRNGELAAEYARVIKTYYDAGQTVQMQVYPAFRNLYQGGKVVQAYQRIGGKWWKCVVEGLKRAYMCGPLVYRHCYDEAALYPRNLPDVLAETPWKYQTLAIQKTAQSQPFYVYDTLKELAKHPQAEYLIRAGLYNLGQALLLGWEQYFDLTQKKLHRLLKLPDKRYVAALVQLNADTDTLDCVQKIEALGNKVRGGMLAPDVLQGYVKRAGIYVDELMEYFVYTTPYKILRYLKGKSKVKIGLWMDYLRFSKELGRDLRKEFVLFPKDLRERHDELARLRRNKRNELADAYIREQWASQRDVWGWSNGGFFIRLPKSAWEVIDEGHRQKHCVGRYLDRIYEQKSVILFLRKEQEPDKPFYTVEYANERIVQYQGFDNKPVPGYEIPVANFIRRYQETINRRLGKEKRLRSAA